MLQILPLLFTLLAAPEPVWQRHASPVTDDLHNAFFVDGSNGWILAHQSGAVLHTTDGGASWKVQARLGEGFLESIYFLDAKRGWIVGDATEADPGVLFETLDGGAVWSRVEIKTPDLHRFAKSPGRVWIVGKGGTILSR